MKENMRVSEVVEAVPKKFPDCYVQFNGKILKEDDLGQHWLGKRGDSSLEWAYLRWCKQACTTAGHSGISGRARVVCMKECGRQRVSAFGAGARNLQWSSPLGIWYKAHRAVCTSVPPG